MCAKESRFQSYYSLDLHRFNERIWKEEVKSLAIIPRKNFLSQSPIFLRRQTQQPDVAKLDIVNLVKEPPPGFSSNSYSIPTTNLNPISERNFKQEVISKISLILGFFQKLFLEFSSSRRKFVRGFKGSSGSNLFESQEKQ